MSRLVYVLNGPNLNLLGKRQPEIYGRETLDDIAAALHRRAGELGLEIDVRQSNHEGYLVDWLHEAAATGAKAVIVNPGAYTHTSIALLDAVRASGVPVVEVHLSNPEAREPFRRRSRVAPACIGKVAGFGASSYVLALAGLLAHLERMPKTP